MGYVRKNLKLVFDDPELDGFEVRARRMSVGQLLKVEKLKALAISGDASPEVREALKMIFAALAGDPELPDEPGMLLSWNLEEPIDPRDEDSPLQPVPLTPESLARQDMGLVMSILGAIREATTAVPAPLAQTSTGGVPSVEASLPMEPLSENPPN